MIVKIKECKCCKNYIHDKYRGYICPFCEQPLFTTMNGYVKVSDIINCLSYPAQTCKDKIKKLIQGD